MIIDQIKKANVEAIKTKDQTARALYSVLLNKIKQADLFVLNLYNISI